MLSSELKPEYDVIVAGARIAGATVGDAAMHQDPWSGMGMGMPGVHATFLAEALLNWFGGTTSEAEAMASYHTRRNEHGLESSRQTVMLAADLRQLTAA